MRTPMQRKYAIAWRIGGARVGEKNFLLLFAHGEILRKGGN